eukprot:1177194-Prorocentrum_minimum.AAC.6
MFYRNSLEDSMHLTGELLGAELVEHDELLPRGSCLQVAEGVEDDLADEGVVRHHHRHVAEERLQVVGQLRPAREWAEWSPPPRIPEELALRNSATQRIRQISARSHAPAEGAPRDFTSKTPTEHGDGQVVPSAGTSRARRGGIYTPSGDQLTYPGFMVMKTLQVKRSAISTPSNQNIFFFAASARWIVSTCSPPASQCYDAYAHVATHESSPQEGRVCCEPSDDLVQNYPPLAWSTETTNKQQRYDQTNQTHYVRVCSHDGPIGPTCCATTESTSSSMRLNSSKHAHAPQLASPLKNLPMAT